MDKSFVPIPDIDVAEELYNIRMAGLDTSLVPGYKELSRQILTALDALLEAYPEADRLEKEDNLIEPLTERTVLLQKILYRQGLIDGIKLMVNPLIRNNKGCNQKE